MASITDGTIKGQVFNAVIAYRIDVVDATTTYEGFADPLVIDSESKWLIKRITTTGNVKKTEIAIPLDNLSLYSNIWNNRSILTYK